jgi:hypothetical protein
VTQGRCDIPNQGGDTKEYGYINPPQWDAMIMGKGLRNTEVPFGQGVVIPIQEHSQERCSAHSRSSHEKGGRKEYGYRQTGNNQLTLIINFMA